MKPIRIGACGIGCEKCPRLVQSKCPNGENRCIPKENKFCKIASCAFTRKMRFCFECGKFPCEITKTGPIQDGYCQYLFGKE